MWRIFFPPIRGNISNLAAKLAAHDVVAIYLLLALIALLAHPKAISVVGTKYRLSNDICSPNQNSVWRRVQELLNPTEYHHQKKK